MLVLKLNHVSKRGPWCALPLSSLRVVLLTWFLPAIHNNNYEPGPLPSQTTPDIHSHCGVHRGYLLAHMFILRYVCTGECHYNMVNFVQNNHNGHPKNSHAKLRYGEYCVSSNLGCRPIHPAWLSIYMNYNVWGELTYPFPNFDSATVEVWEWVNNFISHFSEHVITYPCRYYV